MEVSASNSGRIVFPSVVPGMYSKLDYGRLVLHLSAVDRDGLEISSQRVGPSEWRVADPARLRAVEYLIDDSFGTNLDPPISYVGGTEIDVDHALVNWFGILGFVPELQSRPVRLALEVPAGWSVSTALETAADGTFRARSYDAFVDAPLLAGRLTSATSTAGTIQVELSAYSSTDQIGAKAPMAVAEPVLRAAAGFITFAPVDRYVFLMEFLDSEARSRNGIRGMGALEHGTSSTFTMADGERVLEILPEWLAHEFFHVVTPLSLHSDRVHPFDFTRPRPDEHAWLYEGVTVWASELMLVHAEERTPEEFLASLSQKVRSARDFRQDLSLTEISLASYDPELGDQFENMDYRGAVAAALLDVLLLDCSDGEAGLRDVLMELAREFGAERPFPADELFALFEARTGPEAGEFLRRHVKGAAEPDYAGLMEPVGVSYDPGRGFAFVPDVDERVLRLRGVWLMGR